MLDVRFAIKEVAQKIREKRDKIQKVIDEENSFRMITAFHATGRRGFSEIEMREFYLLVKELDWVLGLLVEGEKDDGVSKRLLRISKREK